MRHALQIRCPCNVFNTPNSRTLTRWGGRMSESHAGSTLCRNSRPLHGRRFNLRLKNQTHDGRIYKTPPSNSGHPARLAPRSAGVDALVAELLLDAHELVVLRIAIRAARRSRLDLTRAQADGQVRDGRVLSLARAVRAHHAPAVLLAKLDCINGLRDSADLVDLQQEGIASLIVDGLLHARDVSHRQVIADHLSGSADTGGEGGPARPVVLVEGILDGDQRVVRGQLRVEVGELCARHLQLRRLLGLGVPRAQVVAIHPLDLELRGGDIHADLANILVTGLLDGLHNELHALLRVARRGEAALVADERRVAAVLLLDDALQGVVALTSHTHRLLEGGGADWNDEVLLEGKLVAGMRAAVDHVEARHGQGQLVAVARQLREVLVKRDALPLGRRLGRSHGHAEDGVGAQLALVRRAVELAHLLVQGSLLTHIHALDARVQNRVHSLDGLCHALAEVPTLVLVPELASLVDAGGGARGNSCTGHNATLGDQVHLDGGIATAV
mmetsp:Transcript_14093/g.37517  ORF Transcript_14093/g.37517 Transcript_14093/m.37517 type:complete len:501 (-) Transcript_14093:189-1691(-)